MNPVIRFIGFAIVIVLLAPFLMLGPRIVAINTEYNFDNASNLTYNWLPNASTSVFCRGTGLYRIYEFTCSENSFVAWSRQVDVPLREINGGIEVKRYLYLDEKTKEMKTGSDRWLQQVTAKIEKGLSGERRQEHGGGFTIAYDRTGKIGYVDWSHH